jgi:hypothetical protein
MTKARRGVKFGRRTKLTPAQITKASKLIEAGERRHGRALERGPDDAFPGPRRSVQLIVFVCGYPGASFHSEPC